MDAYQSANKTLHVAMDWRKRRSGMRRHKDIAWCPCGGRDKEEINLTAGKDWHHFEPESPARGGEARVIGAPPLHFPWRDE